MSLYENIKNNFKEANSMKVSKDITKNKDFSNSLKKLGYDKIIGKANAKDNKTLVANNKGDSLVIDKNKGKLNKFKAAGKKANFKKDEEKELMRYKTESAMRKRRLKESAVVNKEADYGSIADIDGIQCYIAGSTQQGYCFKDMSVYENDPNGVCYICEHLFDDYCAEYDPDRRLRDAAIPVEFIEKNKEKLIKDGGVSTRNSIIEEVRAMLGYSWYYDTADGKHIEGKDFDDGFVSRLADDVIDIVDWQSTSAYINADLDNEDVIGESIEDYYDKKFNTMKESEAEDKKDVSTGLLQKVLDKAEELGWSYSETNFAGDEVGYEFENYSPAGEDYIIDACCGAKDLSDDEKAKNLVEEIRTSATNFDADEHIEMWIEARGNGVSGVPSTRELVDDADEIQKMLDEFSDGVDSVIKGANKSEKLEEAEAKKGPTLEEDEYDAVDYFLTDSKMYDSGFYLKQDKNMKDFFVDAGENNKKYSLKNGLQVIYEAMVPEYIAEYPKEIQKGLEKVMRKYLGDAVGDEIKSWCSKSVKESQKLKESSYANNKLLDAVKDYGIVSVNLDEMKNSITFRVPRAKTGDDPNGDGYVCATVDFIERVESALREMGIDADVFGEGESASDFGTFTLTYEPKARGTF